MTGEGLWGAVVREGEGNFPRETLEQLQGTGGDRVEDEEGAAVGGKLPPGEDGGTTQGDLYGMGQQPGGAGDVSGGLMEDKDIS